MLIKRKSLYPLLTLFERIKDKKFNIETQYKIIKIIKAVEPEQEILQEQIKSNCDEYFEKDGNNNPITNEQGGFKIKSNKATECYLIVDKLEDISIQIPDIYFSLEELSPLDLTLEEIKILEPFIKF